MLDELVAGFRHLQRVDQRNHREDYRPNQAIVGRNFIESAGETLTVVFPVWGGSNLLQSQVNNRLVASGSSVLDYQFDSNILNIDPVSVRQSFEHIADTISSDVEMSRSNFKKIHLLGMSLGSVALAMVLKRLERVDRIDMVVPGANLADAFWDGLRTRGMSNRYRANGYSLPDLQAEWHELAPITHSGLLSAHPLGVVLAARDRFIPYASGRQLIESLKNAADLQVDTCRAGHVLTLARYAFGNFSVFNRV